MEINIKEILRIINLREKVLYFWLMATSMKDALAIHNVTIKASMYGFLGTVIQGNGVLM